MKRILDACCGGRMFWFDKQNNDVLFIDNRVHPKEKLSNGQSFSVQPDRVMDFRKMELPDNSFSMVVFDPPHLSNCGEKGWMAKKYGKLGSSWRDDIAAGFRECFRVLKPNGALIFKWSEHDIAVSEVLRLTPEVPLFGHRAGSARSKTHWLVFMKSEACAA